MICIIISTEELLDFIKDHPVAIVEFKANWCSNCARIAPIYQSYASKYTGMKFGNIDIEYVGQANLDKLKINLNLGAIPSFYIYKDGQLIDRLISGSPTKLESFIETYYVGEISVQSSFLSNSNYNFNSSTSQSINSIKSFFIDDSESASNEIMPKCTKCSQYGHRARDCYNSNDEKQESMLNDRQLSEKLKKENKLVCSNCGKVHPVWDLKCMKNSEKKINLNGNSYSNSLLIKEFKKEKQLTSLGENGIIKNSKSIPKLSITYEKPSGINSINSSRENLRESEIGISSKLTSLGENGIIKNSKSMPKLSIAYEKPSGINSINSSRENLRESEIGISSKLASLGENGVIKSSRSLLKFALSYEKSSSSASINTSRENLRENEMGSNIKLNEKEKKRVTWNLVPVVKETNGGQTDIVKELLDKLSKLEVENKKRESVFLTVKRQKEIIQFLKDKVDTLTIENNFLKRSKSAELVKEVKNK